MIPESERRANAAKAKTDAKAAELLDLDQESLKKSAERLATKIRSVHGFPLPTIVMTGGAGSGKTTLAGALSKSLEVPVYDFDEYIKGGWTADREKYEKRLKEAVYDLWADLPNTLIQRGWIVEHVEACNPDIVGILRPNYAVLLDPGDKRIRLTADARDLVGKYDPNRKRRALESMARAKKQFDALPGEIVAKDGDCIVKSVES